MILETKTPDQTRRLGRKLGKLLRGGDVVCLFGNLGSGKTTLTQGVAAGAGFRGRVVSPTFGLARLYRAKGLTLYHLDLYRVGEDTADIGLEDFLGDPAGVCLIEWPEAAKDYLPRERLEARLSHRKEGRRLAFKARGKRARELLRRLK